MEKKRLFMAVTGLVLSLITLIVISFSWFAISTEVQTSPLELNVGTGLIAQYEIKFYTVNKVYKYDQPSDSILVWNGSGWVSPVYEDPDLTSFPFSGIFLNQYDPLIDLNNVNNQVFIELKLVYDIDQDSTLSINFNSDLDIATGSISTFGYSTSRPYYLSEVLYIQQMQTNTYSANPDGNNIYNTLSSDFNQLDINENLVYPKYSFYTQINNPVIQPETYYTTSVATNSINLLASAPTPEVYVYFKFSYIDDIIEFIISEENINIAVNNGNGIVFFQDIKIKVNEVSS